MACFKETLRYNFFRGVGVKVMHMALKIMHSIRAG